MVDFGWILKILGRFGGLFLWKVIVYNGFIMVSISYNRGTPNSWMFFFGGKSYEIDCFFQYQNGQWIDTRFS